MERDRDFYIHNKEDYKSTNRENNRYNNNSRSHYIPKKRGCNKHERSLSNAYNMKDKRKRSYSRDIRRTNNSNKYSMRHGSYRFKGYLQNNEKDRYGSLDKNNNYNRSRRDSYNTNSLNDYYKRRNFKLTDKYNHRKEDKEIQSKSPKRKSTSRGSDKHPHFKWNDGMVLKDRYVVVGILGNGTFGRVLECFDLERRETVAIKIVRDIERYTSAAKLEAENIKELMGQGRRKIYHNNQESRIVKLYSTFILYSRHMCLVFEKLGPSLYDILYNNSLKGFFIEDIQIIAKQVLQSLSYLHRAKLTHTDLKPENILINRDRSYERVQLPRSRKRCIIKRYTKLDIRLIDFGSSTFSDQYHSTIINTRQYRAPEVIMKLGWDTPSDIWGIGCILMELYTGDLLFPTHQHMEHLAMINNWISAIPKWMCKEARSTDSYRYIHPKRDELYWPNPESSSRSIRLVSKENPLYDDIIDCHSIFRDFILYLLDPDPYTRPSANDALKHKFFRVKLSESGK